MPNLDRYFLRYQLDWIRCSRPIALAEKARRIGWTYASSFRAVERRAKLNTDLFYSSADLSGAREFVEQCQRWARVFDVVAKDMGLQVINEDGLQAFVLQFNTGARILAGSSNPKFFRGKGGDTDADEFAFHPQQRQLYKAMQPASLTWGHQLRLWSTHNGEGSFFQSLIQQSDGRSGRRGGKTAPQLYRVTLHDAIEAGLVEKIRGISGTDPKARQEFLEEIRASCTDENAWNEEYLCEPANEDVSLLGYALIGTCEEENLALWDIDGNETRRSVLRTLGTEGLTAPQAPQISRYPRLVTPPAPGNGSSLYAGFDLGRSHDRSVLWVLERVGDIFWTRIVRVLENAPFAAQEQLIDLTLRRLPVRRVCIDSTGMGAMFAERLGARWGHRVEAVTFTATSKAAMALPLLRLFQERRVRIPAAPAIREDLHKIRRVVTAARNVRFDASRDTDGHGDRFWALALAHHAAENEPGTLPTVALKPSGW